MTHCTTHMLPSTVGPLQNIRSVYRSSNTASRHQFRTLAYEQNRSPAHSDGTHTATGLARAPPCTGPAATASLGCAPPPPPPLPGWNVGGGGWTQAIERHQSLCAFLLYWKKLKELDVTSACLFSSGGSCVVASEDVVILCCGCSGVGGGAFWSVCINMNEIIVTIYASCCNISKLHFVQTPLIAAPCTLTCCPAARASVI